MKDREKAISLMVLATISIAIGQVFWKFASESLSLNIATLISNTPLLMGFFFNGFGFIFMLMALRKEDLSFIHPFLALSFIWTLILANLVLGEKITSIKIAGTSLILIGAITLGRKS